MGNHISADTKNIKVSGETGNLTIEVWDEQSPLKLTLFGVEFHSIEVGSDLGIVFHTPAPRSLHVDRGSIGFTITSYKYERTDQS